MRSEGTRGKYRLPQLPSKRRCRVRRPPGRPPPADLSGHHLFRDIDTIASGIDFTVELDRRLSACNVMLSMVGPHWLSEPGPQGRRIDDPQDWVRRELAAALQRGVLVIPVLVGGASLPSPSDLPEELRKLSNLQAHELTETRWDYDVQQLASRLFVLPGFEFEMKLSAMDREWEIEKSQYMVKDKEGHTREPSSTISTVIFMGIFSVLWFFAAQVLGQAFTETGVSGWWSFAFSLFAPVMALAGLAVSIPLQRKYVRFKKARNAYQDRRALLLVDQRARLQEATWSFS